MGYQVKSQPYGRGWKVLLVTHINGKPKARALRPEEFRAQFGGVTTIEDAKALASRLNASQQLHHIEERKRRIHERLEEEDLALLVHLPEVFIREFEESGKLYGDTIPDSKESMDHLWRSCKRLLVALKLTPDQWDNNREKFYAYFRERRYALSTVQKMTLLLNRWGKFISRKEGKFFDPLPTPKRRARQAIADANRKKPRGKGAKTGGNVLSKPLSFALLAAKESAFKKEYYNWLYVSVAFGLRPEEIDERSGEEPLVFLEKDGKPVIQVYQSKLQLIDYEKRWKNIPAVLPEQLTAIEILKNEKLERPPRRLLEEVFGPGYTHYAGRNNFVPMMFEKQRPIEEVQCWMGHQNVETTMRYFRKLQSRNTVVIKK